MNKIIIFSVIILIILSTHKISGQSINKKSSKTDNTEASIYTTKANSNFTKYLDFSDTTDFTNATRGFIATIPDGIIMDEASGRTSYNMNAFDFLKGDAPSTVNPSLWRQSKLNAINGLFKVADGIYQIRGFDLANMTLIRGKTGWIVIDPLTSQAPVKAGMQLIKEQLGDLPVKAVIITHSHVDHFGGMRALVSEEDIKSGKIEVIAPKGFFENAVSENVMAGNVMSRRAMYMYGLLLPKNPKGSLGSGLGTTTSVGQLGILPPSDIVKSETGESRVIDGIRVEFIYTPESEAPAEMMFYFPDYKAFCQAECMSHTNHNLITLRGAQVRNGQKWSMYIDRALEKFGEDVEISFGCHHWPVWGNKEVVAYWESQRDLYRFMHDQTLRLANHGKTSTEIAEELLLPEGLAKKFYNRDYYGTVSHNAKGQYQMYFGWFDGNPSNLNPLPPVEVGKKYVEYMGGAGKVIKMAQKSYDNGEYRWVAEVLKHVVFADDTNQKAKNLLADTYTQLGYVAESGSWRNFYLTGAMELRNGVNRLPIGTTVSPDMVKGMSTELFFNYLAMRYKGMEENTNKYNFNLVLPDTGENVALILSNGTMSVRVNKSITKNITATVTVNRIDLSALTTPGQNVTFDDLLKSGKMKIVGNTDAFRNTLANLDSFDNWFNIVED